MAITITNLTPMPPGLTLLPSGKVAGQPTAPFSGSVQIQATDGVSTVVGLWHFNAGLPQIPASILTQIIEIEDFSRPTIAALPEFEIIPLFTTPTIDSITIAAPVSVADFSTPTIEDALLAIIDLSTPFIENLSVGGGGFSSAIATPLGTAGLTQVVNTPVDDSYYLCPDIGFDLYLYGSNCRTSLYVGSNSYITFASGSNAYNSFSNSYPGAGLFIGAADRSWREIWLGNDTPNTFRVRFEGYSGSSTGPPSDSFWEVTFFDDGVIMLVTGAIGGGGGFSAITDGTGGNANSYTVGPNNSWVFQPTANGDFTIQNGSYS